jgi:hypothetical protein
MKGVTDGAADDLGSASEKDPRDFTPTQHPGEGACACLILLGISGLLANADVLWLTLLSWWSAANTAESCSSEAVYSFYFF